MTLGERLFAALENPKVRELVGKGYGIPYDWAAGDPNDDPFDPRGKDCSGAAQGNSVFLGLLKKSEPDRNAYNLAMICDKVELGQERLGDFVFYGRPITHVMLCIAPGIAFGETGGGSATHGDDPRAFQDIRKIDYRPITVIGRLKPAFTQS